MPVIFILKRPLRSVADEKTASGYLASQSHMNPRSHRVLVRQRAHDYPRKQKGNNIANISEQNIEDENETQRFAGLPRHLVSSGNHLVLDSPGLRRKPKNEYCTRVLHACLAHPMSDQPNWGSRTSPKPEARSLLFLLLALFLLLFFLGFLLQCALLELLRCCITPFVA